MAENIYNWQYNTIPGNANQGAVLMTRNNIGQPPFNQSDFIWKAMEDVFGVSNIKLDYDEENNVFTLSKATGHLDNEDKWTYDWEVVGSWEPITEEVAQALRDLKYVSYRYDTSVANTLTVYGIKKDMTEDLMVSIQFISKDEADQIFSRLDHKIEDETARATNREDELEDMIEHNQAISGSATTVTQSSNGRIVDVNVDDDSIKVGSDNKLKADVFDDTQVRNDKGWSSAKIAQQLTSAMHYKGQVATYADLPTTGQQVGDLYNVEDTGDNYAWNGTSWDKLSGEYVEGKGIRIQGKVISATGIAFEVGDGLETTGTGDNTTLKTKNGYGLEIDGNGANKVKSGNGIDVNANGVSIKLSGNNPGLVVDSNGLRVSASDGLHTFTEAVGDIPIYYERVGINANFNKKTTPLGTDSSKLAIYSDGKIGVDFTESPVVLTGELLYQGVTSASDGKLAIGDVPNLGDYDMYYIGIYQDAVFSNEMASQIFYKPENKVNINITKLAPATPPATYQDTPLGMVQLYYFVQGFDAANNRVDGISGYGSISFLATTEQWTQDRVNPRGIRIYGIKAR